MCTPRDSVDTTCDHVDDDCDGTLDEDCSFGPAQCPAGYHVIAGTSGADMLVGTAGRDCILGYGGDDLILGLAGDDLLVGGPGNDYIFGAGGKDTIQGGTGDDHIYGGPDKDTIDGGDGNDTIDGEGGGDIIHGGACHDTLRGSSGADQVFGDGGSDRILECSGNGVDGGAGVDACDGHNCEVSQSSARCTRDADCHNGKRCVVPTGICVAPNQASFTDKTCDGIDDDCDGKIDEDYVSTQVSCGGGACGGVGMTKCVNGHEQTTCQAGGTPHGTTDATCDGVDDDCDGKIDENYTGTTTSCGIGACTRSGTSVCVNGTVQSGCTAGTPGASDASCNGVDDNCNGLVDEGFAGTSTSCGVGACARNGTSMCVSGMVQSGCTPGTPAASDASCDGIDDNCNGAADEGYVSLVTTCGVGACGAMGATMCMNGAVLNTCTPGVPAPSDATCDGIDDNCNGVADEGYMPMATSCGIGACFRSGATACVGGTVQNNCTPGMPAPSDATCDNIDDNCNGTNDEDYVRLVTTCGQGACFRTGGTSCVNGAVQNSCTPGPAAPSDTVCNNVDDDCDGHTDEDFVSQQTSCGIGGCARNGATSCVGGSVQDNCSPGAPTPSDTSCDGVDNNCNGATDEGYVATASNCGIGACARTGSNVCTNGTVHDTCTPGQPAPSDATCDAIDDNCNGTNDEGYVPVVTTCGLGACFRTGSSVCVSGAVQSTCTPGPASPTDTTCNGVDENCNGVADEGFVPSCAGTQTRTCVGGAVQTHECVDSDPCNGTETCSAGACQPGTSIVDDGDPCTTDSCTAGGGVTHTPVAAGTSCADGNVCNGSETCQPTTGCVAAPSGMVAWWPGDFNANDIATHADASAPYNGTLQGGLGFIGGKVAQAFNFDGVDDTLDLSAYASALNLASTGKATLEMWIRVPADTCQTVFNLRQDSNDQQYLQVGNGCVGGITNELVTWTYISGGTAEVTAFATGTRNILVDATTFHHLVLTFDGSAVRIYIDDGAPRATTTTGTPHGVWGSFAAPNAVTVGGPVVGSGAFFNGRIDELTLYNRALSQLEVRSIFLASSAGKCKPPVCTGGTPAPAGTSCGTGGGTCDGTGICSPPP